MSVSAKLPGIEQLSIEEKLTLMEEIWEDICTEKSALELTPEQVEEIDRRLAELEAHPERVIPWEEIKADYRKRRVQ